MCIINHLQVHFLKILLVERSVGKLANTERLISAMDEVDYLQVYVHDFENWDGKTALPSTFTPLTINDVDVTELTMYDTLGRTYTLKVNTIPLDYPLLVVGMNEDMNYYSEDGSTFSLGKITTEPTITIKEVKLDRSAWDYEPWWKGKAELYFRIYDYNANIQGSENAADWIPWVGQYAPQGGSKSYKCWKWISKWWGGYYVQDKPWRTIDLNTDWSPYDFLPASQNNYALRVMEYDPFFYDGGIDKWCTIIGLAGFAATYESTHDVKLSVILGIALDAVCEIALNDDVVDETQNFETAISWANSHQGSSYQWDDNQFSVKVVVD